MEWTCVHVPGYRPEEGVRVPRAGVTGGSELSDMSQAGN